MTLEQAIINVYVSTYEQSDLNPYAGAVIDLASAGAVELTAAINRATNIVSTWKFPNGYRPRFKSTEGHKIVQTYDNVEFLLGDQSLASGDRVVIVGVPPNNMDDYYAGWTIVIDGETYYGVQSVGSVVTLDRDRPPIIQGLPCTMYQKRLYIGTDISLPQYIAIRSIYDMKNKQEFERVVDSDDVLFSFGSFGIPSTYAVDNNAIVFDQALSGQLTLGIRYWKYPRPCAALTDVIDLPEAFHDAVSLVARADIFQRIGEVQNSYSTWKKAEALMANLRAQFEFESESYDSRLYPKE